MVHRLSVALRVLPLASAATLALFVACSGDQPVMPGPEASQPAIRPNPLNANPPPWSGRTLSPAAAIITNGTVMLGVHDFGNLNIPGGTPSNGTSSVTTVGLRYVPTNSEGTSPGCLCEGWGVADASTGEFANASFATGGFDSVTLVSFTSTATTATSVVDAFGRLRITHDFKPSPATPSLYQIDITIENTSATPIGDLRYTRGMDFDEAPNTFSEFVTIQGTAGASAVLLANNNGFNDVNPLAPHPSLGFSGDFVDAGPDDHGAHFDFGFGALAPGATKTLTLFYGAAATEADAFAALFAVSAEIFAFGQADCSSCSTWVPAPGVGHTTGTEGATTGRPHTHIFAFAGVGGTPIPPGNGGGPGTCKGQPTSPGVTKFTFGGVTTFIGTFGDDVIGGTNGIDLVLGKSGDDDICTYKGIDTVHAGAGDDEVFGGNGGDFLFGLTGADQLFGEQGPDRLDGGHTPVPSSTADEDTDVCNGGTQIDKFYLCEVKIQ